MKYYWIEFDAYKSAQDMEQAIKLILGNYLIAQTFIHSTDQHGFHKRISLLPYISIRY